MGWVCGDGSSPETGLGSVCSAALWAWCASKHAVVRVGARGPGGLVFAPSHGSPTRAHAPTRRQRLCGDPIARRTAGDAPAHGLLRAARTSNTAEMPGRQMPMMLVGCRPETAVIGPLHPACSGSLPVSARSGNPTGDLDIGTPVLARATIQRQRHRPQPGPLGLAL